MKCKNQTTNLYSGHTLTIIITTLVVPNNEIPSHVACVNDSNPITVTMGLTGLLGNLTCLVNMHQWSQAKKGQADTSWNSLTNSIFNMAAHPYTIVCNYSYTKLHQATQPLFSTYQPNIIAAYYVL